MNNSDALTSYMAEMADIMQEMHTKMQRVKEMKAEMEASTDKNQGNKSQQYNQ